jgi:hypothetical protein
VIDPKAKTWTPVAQEVQRGGRVSPDGTKYAWCLPAPGETRATLCLVDLRRHAEPMKIPMEGLSGHCSW